MLPHKLFVNIHITCRATFKKVCFHGRKEVKVCVYMNVSNDYVTKLTPNLDK